MAHVTPTNVHPDHLGAVQGDPAASEFASAIEGLFAITGYASLRRRGGRYVSLFCKPTRAVADSLLVNREVLVLIANYDSIDPRAVSVAKDLIHERNPQLATEIAIVLHSDPEGDGKLRQWGKEQAIRLVPVYRPRASAQSRDATLRQQLSASLLSVDPFQVTGPVADDTDFFGRRNDALDILRQLENGRIRAIFGIRKIGKTSFINRLIALARDKGSPRIAMVDCSLKEFSRLDAQGALRALAKLSRMASTRGYAHVSEALGNTKDELLPSFSDLWLKDAPGPAPLAIIFDEVDYITPASPTAPHWASQFNDFWREFRVLVQEAQRHAVPIAVLVSGVSSRYFREGSIGGVENAALFFVPDEYLPLFGRAASDAMIKELGRRCGLSFTPDARRHLAVVCNDLPFWIRMAGSYLHRSIDMDARPVVVELEVITELLDAFVRSEGVELSRVALQHLQGVHPEVVSLLRRCVASDGLPLSEGRLLSHYGLATSKGGKVHVMSELVRLGLEEVNSQPAGGAGQLDEKMAATQQSIEPSSDVWAEELAVIGRRRNQVEKSLRQLVRFALRVEMKPGQSWVELVLSALPEKRRSELTSLSAATLMDKLYWLELSAVVAKHWSCFERIFGDKNRFTEAMKLVNDRPDTHAKNFDLADFALQRRELTWLEERVNS